MLNQIIQIGKRLATAPVAMCLLLVCLVNPALAEQPAVAVVLSENSGAYLEFANALREELERRHIPAVVIDHPGGALPQPSLVVGVGMKAAATVAAGDAPAVLNVLAPKAGHEKLLRDFPRRARSKNYSALFLDQPASRQVSLLVAALPEAKRIGVMYATPSAEIAQLGREMRKHGLVLVEQAISSAFPLNDALNSVLKESQALLALPDAEVYNNSTVRNILLATYRSGAPLIGFSQGYVKAGALCAVYSTPAQLAAQTAALVEKFAETRALPPPQYPQEFEVGVNEQVARSLGVRIKSAGKLRDEIQGLERNEP